jgi:hypothetical protein
MKPLGPTRQPPGPNHGAAHADHVRTVAAALFAHHFAAQLFCRPRPPPRAAIRGVPRQQAPPFRPSSSAHAPPLLLLMLCRCRSLHRSPPSATSSGHPSARPSSPPAPPRASAPLQPFQLWPLTAAPPRSMRTPTSPTAPIWILPLRCHA